MVNQVIIFAHFLLSVVNVWRQEFVIHQPRRGSYAIRLAVVRELFNFALDSDGVHPRKNTYCQYIPYFLVRINLRLLHRSGAKRVDVCHGIIVECLTCNDGGIFTASPLSPCFRRRNDWTVISQRRSNMRRRKAKSAVMAT